MNNWDDLRYFLAVARKGSIRAAAIQLGVNHSTVSRRIDAFEKKLNARLFVRMPTGYFVTQAGEDMIEAAERIEVETNTIDRRVVGRDTRLAGILRVTLHDSLAQKLLMPAMAEFCHTYPGIELALEISNSMADLAKREADVAIRITNDPTDNLVGRRIVKYATAIYACKDYLATHDLSNRGAALSWIGWNDKVAHPQWVRESPYSKAPIRHQIFNPLSQMEAIKSGMGIAMMPCFIGDTEPDLRRLPPGIAMPNREIWILTHEDLRHTARVKQFVDFISKAIRAKRDLLEGRCPSTDNTPHV